MKRSAIFLDRDGTINELVDPRNVTNKLLILPMAAEAIRELNKMGFVVIVITNQAAIARGLLTEHILHEIHESLRLELLRSRAVIDAFYHCPHHPTEAIVSKYNLVCSCRKPATGLIQNAVEDFDINVERSFLIGDMTTDIAAGRAMGIKTILVETGFAGKDKLVTALSDYTSKHLMDAVSIIRQSIK